ncbi:hypothetical protein [uncultured Helicobacter sp.]|uniref:hypothetical protein n=1 Tax=uncultured Helicobacter sp. TaxID=175537 RepID=UPI003751E494
MTNFFVCNSELTQSTPSRAKPRAECKENTESKERLESSPIDSESKKLTQSTKGNLQNAQLTN